MDENSTVRGIMETSVISMDQQTGSVFCCVGSIFFNCWDL